MLLESFHYLVLLYLRGYSTFGGDIYMSQISPHTACVRLTPATTPGMLLMRVKALVQLLQRIGSCCSTMASSFHQPQLIPQAGPQAGNTLNIGGAQEYPAIACFPAQVAAGEALLQMAATEQCPDQTGYRYRPQPGERLECRPVAKGAQDVEACVLRLQ